jgi:hypothetical protein
MHASTNTPRRHLNPVQIPTRKRNLFELTTSDRKLKATEMKDIRNLKDCPPAAAQFSKLRFTPIGTSFSVKRNTSLEATQGQTFRRSHLILVACVWELAKEIIDLPLGCLQGGMSSTCALPAGSCPPLSGNTCSSLT